MPECEHDLKETRGDTEWCKKCGLIFKSKTEFPELKKPVILTLKPPPTVLPPLKKISRRKTITIQESEFNKWVNIKGVHSWTSLLQTVREGHEFFKKVIENLTVSVNSMPEPAGQSIQRIRRTPSSIRVQKNNPKSQMLQELRKLTNGEMSVTDFRKSVLRPMTEDELLKIQKSDDELEEAQNIRLEPV